jgi:type I restriction enzyme S subunit
MALRTERFMGEGLPIPPVDDQAAIASYLDTETMRIDGLIDEKQRLLDYLQGMRSAIVVAAMLNDTDGDQLVSRSDAPWMGRLPADWKRMTLTRISKERALH